jgi:hypothetical protein
MDALVRDRAAMNLMCSDNEKDLPNVCGRRKRENTQMQSFPTSQAISKGQKDLSVSVATIALLVKRAET